MSESKIVNKCKDCGGDLKLDRPGAMSIDFPAHANLICVDCECRETVDWRDLLWETVKTESG